MIFSLFWLRKEPLLMALGESLPSLFFSSPPDTPYVSVLISIPTTTHSDMKLPSTGVDLCCFLFLGRYFHSTNSYFSCRTCSTSISEKGLLWSPNRIHHIVSLSRHYTLSSSAHPSCCDWNSSSLLIHQQIPSPFIAGTVSSSTS